MESLQKWVVDLNGVVWGPLMLVLILGTGLYLMLGLKFMPLVRLGVGFRLLWQGRSKDDESSGEISPFQALMTCLAATVGTGNSAGGRIIGRRRDRLLRRGVIGVSKRLEIVGLFTHHALFSFLSASPSLSLIHI